MDAQKLNEALRLHKLWLDGDPEGSKAYLRRANLEGAHLEWASLSGANLEWASLEGANLEGANLEGAYLRGAHLEWANLRRANLEGANLEGANLEGANLEGASLEGANLEGASLSGAKDIPKATQALLQVCPEAGGFTAYKKLKGGLIATLYIPSSAQRSSATTRKCRASKAKVIAITDATGKAYNEGFSNYKSGFIYKVGEYVEPTKPFNPDRWNECASGIHFFITRQEALDY